MSKTVNTRIKLKYDTLANWESNNPVLLAGEIACVTISEANVSESELPPVMFKVGDGTSTFKQLKWTSAKAADVYSWAKQSKLGVTSSGSGNAVTGITADSSGITYTMGTFSTTDTKITAGATNDVASKLFLIGAKTQDASPQTYSDKLLFVQGEYLSAPNIVPVSTNTYTLGTSTLNWGAVYASTVNATTLKGTYLISKASGAQNLTIPSGTSGGTNTLALTSDIPTALPAAYPIKFRTSETSEASYDGSSELDLTGGIYYAKTAGSATSASSAGIATNLGSASGSYTYDTLTAALSNKADKSSIPTVNNGKLTLQVAGVEKATFTANQSGPSTFNVTAADLGLSSAMTFGGIAHQTLSERGTQNATETSGNYTTSTQPSNGTVYLDRAGHLEYVWACGAPSALGYWELLGQDGSYALSSVTVTGEGALSGGGSLEADRTITHNAGNAPSKSSGLYKFSTDAYSHIASVTNVTKSDITALGIPSQDLNYYPSRSYTSGLKISTGIGSEVCDLYVPYAASTSSSTQPGVVVLGNNTTMATPFSSATAGTSDRNYYIGKESGGYLTVNVPWSDTTYTADGTYIKLADNKFSLSTTKLVTTDDQVIIDCGSSSANIF